MMVFLYIYGVISPPLPVEGKGLSISPFVAISIILGLIILLIIIRMIRAKHK